MLTASPDRRQHDASGTADDVGQRRVRSGFGDERGVPARRGHQIDQPAKRDQLAARGEQLQRRRVTSQPVIEGRLQSDARLGAKPCHDSGREDLLEIVVRPVQGDLGQHRCQSGDPCVQRVASSAGAVSCCSAGTVAGSHGPSSSATRLTTQDHAASPKSRYASIDAIRSSYGAVV